MESRARLVGFNHIALEVGDLEAALDFYGRIFQFELRGRSRGMAFVDAGDQFLALSEGRTQPPDEHRHFGLVVDDKRAVRKALREAGVEIIPGKGPGLPRPLGQPLAGGRVRRGPIHQGAARPERYGAGGSEED